MALFILAARPSGYPLSALGRHQLYLAIVMPNKNKVLLLRITNSNFLAHLFILADIGVW